MGPIRTYMGERINNVHGSLIPCHIFYDIDEKRSPRVRLDSSLTIVVRWLIHV